MVDDIEEIARLLYETMFLRVYPGLDPLIHEWEIQSDELREDWRAVALKALELARI